MRFTTTTRVIRLIVEELFGFQKILDTVNIRMIKDAEPQMYNRLRARAKRDGTIESFDYATALDGTILEDSFDPDLGPKAQARQARAAMRIIKGSTLRSRPMTWASRLLEERINRRYKGTNVRVRVEIGKFFWTKFEKSDKRLTFRFHKVILSPEELENE